MHHANVILYLDVTFHSSELCEALGLPWGFAYLSHAKDTNTFSLCVCVQDVSPTRQRKNTRPHPLSPHTVCSLVMRQVCEDFIYIQCYFAD